MAPPSPRKASTSPAQNAMGLLSSDDCILPPLSGSAVQHGEQYEGGQPEPGAVQGEGIETASSKVSHEVGDAQVGGDPGEHRRDQEEAQVGSGGGIEQPRHLEQPGGRDGRRSEQEEEAGQPEWNRAQDEHPAQALVLVTAQASRDGAAQQGSGDRPPLLPEVDHQRGGGPDVEQGQKGEEGGSGLIDPPAQQPGDDDAVAEAADREQLGDALEQGQYDRLERRHDSI